MAAAVGVPQIALIPDNFCIKYDPPTFGILYHLTSDTSTKFLHHVELNFSKSQDPKVLSKHLFQNESLYLNPQYVKEAQVEKLISKIMMKNGLLASPPDQQPKAEEEKETQEISDYLEDFSELDGTEQNKEDQEEIEEKEEEIEKGETGGPEDEQFITINDMQYRKIQIEGDEEEYLMDPEGNIFNMQGEFIGTANGDKEEEGFDAQQLPF